MNRTIAALLSLFFAINAYASPPVVTSIYPYSGPTNTKLGVAAKPAGFVSARIGATLDASGKYVGGTNVTKFVEWSGGTGVTLSVPEGSSSGYVCVSNADGEGCSKQTFKYQASPTTPVGLSIKVQGSKFVDGTGKVVQLRGVNYSGFEATAIVGWNPPDPSGAQAGQPYGPKLSAIVAWKANVLRLPLNEASWLGLTCTDTDGKIKAADPGNNYQTSVKTQVDAATAAGLYVILDLHWAAPNVACPQLQTQFADADHSVLFWTQVATIYKGYLSVMFELYNEPFFNFDFTPATQDPTTDSWKYMMFGTDSAKGCATCIFSGYPATSNSGTWKDVKKSWKIASYQQLITTIRGTGATNVVILGGIDYSTDMRQWLAHKPTDSLNQMAASPHLYPAYGTTYGSAAYSQPNHPEIYDNIKSILAAGIPVIVTETGDRNATGTTGAPFVSNVTAFADETGISLLGWTWDIWADWSDNVLIKDVNGTPTDGYGVFFKNWLAAH